MKMDNSWFGVWARAMRFSSFLDDTNYFELLLSLHEVFSLGHLLHDVLGEVRRSGRAEAAVEAAATRFLGFLDDTNFSSQPSRSSTKYQVPQRCGKKD